MKNDFHLVSIYKPSLNSNFVPVSTNTNIFVLNKLITLVFTRNLNENRGLQGIWGLRGILGYGGVPRV
jgi:hypothetical protein